MMGDIQKGFFPQEFPENDEWNISHFGQERQNPANIQQPEPTCPGPSGSTEWETGGARGWEWHVGMCVVNTKGSGMQLSVSVSPAAAV